MAAMMRSWAANYAHLSAGSLLVVLLLRTAHYNLAKLRDVYLHTNTLAALANLAPYAQDLSSHAAQRLVSLFDMLARRRAPPCHLQCWTVCARETGGPSTTSVLKGEGCEAGRSGKARLEATAEQCPALWGPGNGMWEWTGPHEPACCCKGGVLATKDLGRLMPALTCRWLCHVVL